MSHYQVNTQETTIIVVSVSICDELENPRCFATARPLAKDSANIGIKEKNQQLSQNGHFGFSRP